MPSARFGECCFTQATHGIRCNVSAGIEWLVIAEFLGYLPLRFSAHGNNTMANALLRVASMVNDSHKEFRSSVDSLDAMQGFCHGSFEAKLCTRMLCSSAFCRDLD